MCTEGIKQDLEHFTHQHPRHVLLGVCTTLSLSLWCSWCLYTSFLTRRNVNAMWPVSGRRFSTFRRFVQWTFWLLSTVLTTVVWNVEGEGVHFLKF